MSKLERIAGIGKSGLVFHSKPSISSEEIEKVIIALNENQLMTGKYSGEFEDNIASYLGINWACAANSGTAALHLALLSLEPEYGEEAILPSYVCYSVLSSVMLSGLNPILADITGCSYNISPESIEEKISENTRAVIIPHMFGEPAEMDKLLKIKDKHPEIAIVEDCAHSVGAEYKGKKLGSIGDISILSFYATKMITSATGGMVVSDSEEKIKQIRAVMEIDEKDEYSQSYPYAMNDISAAIGLAQLSKLPKFITRRKEIASFYDGILGSLGMKRKLLNESISFRYVIERENKEHFIEEMRSEGIVCEKPIYKPLHEYLNLDVNEFPNTTESQRTAVSIPCYPALKDFEVEKTGEALKKIISGKKI
jgi:perosamine synthetase